MSKPFSTACERNRDPILSVLRDHFTDRRAVLEIGSGTGQHAVYFASALPHLIWQPSDVHANLPGIRAWCDEAALDNLKPPLALDVNDENWPAQRYDAIFSANTLHIMSWPEVERLFIRLPEVMTEAAKLVIYGPFNVNGRFTSESNAAFDAQLRQTDPARGIRDAEAVDALAISAGLRLIEDCEMPANNRCRIWQRSL